MKEVLSRCASLQAGLPVCSMSLRPWPNWVGVGGHLRILGPGEWAGAPGEQEQCRCATPEIEFLLSPLGVPIEVLYGSPEHHVCNDALASSEILKAARVELVAEALFVHRPSFWLDGFEDVVVAHEAARRHLLGLTKSRRDQNSLELAQYHARIAVARNEAWRAIGWKLR